VLGFVRKTIGRTSNRFQGTGLCIIYEGYGIPILDAFACEVPVVTSMSVQWLRWPEERPYLWILLKLIQSLKE